MNNSDFSPIADLNAAIGSHNPFKKNAIVKAQDVWGKGFPDVESLNAHASDAVFQAMERVKTSTSTQEKVLSVVFTAEKGVGKSHVISRIRHRLEREGGALFVYASADEYVDLNLIKYQFQQSLVDSLRHNGSQGVMQWQEVATAMANEASKASNPDAQPFAPKQLIEKFDKVYANRESEKKQNLMDRLVDRVLMIKHDVLLHVDPDIVRAILWTLSQKQGAYAINWLSGKEIAPGKAEELGLPSHGNKNNQDREAEALKTVGQILYLVSQYNPVLICFDEIDVINDCDEAGHQTPEVIADLVKRLYDTLYQSARSLGVVMLTVMMPDTWRNTIKQLSGGIPDRVASAGKPIALSYMDGNSIIELVRCWLQDFYAEGGLTPQNPIYPFEKEQLIELGKEKPPVRKVLGWCAENFQVAVAVDPLPKEPLERCEFALNQEKKAILDSSLEDNSAIAKALSFGFESLIGKTLEGETSTGEVLNQLIIEEVTKEVKPKRDNNDWINFKILGQESGKVVKIGLSVVQGNHKSLLAALKRLNDWDKFELTRGCLVRSRSLGKMNKKSDSYKALEELVNKGGEYVELIEEEIKPLLAIHAVYEKREQYQLSAEQILTFVEEKQIAFDNPLLREILSDPSGEVPKVEDDIFSELASENTNDAVDDERDNADEDDLIDLFT